MEGAAWFEDATKRLQDLLMLKPNWDSYGAHVIQPECVSAARSFLSECVGKNTPAPAIVPTPLGGIQVEWNQSEVEFRPNGQPIVYLERPGGMSMEAPLVVMKDFLFEHLGEGVT